LDEVSFGEWLKRRRKALDLTQEQLAQQISCSTSALRKIEAEERRPSEQIVERLAGIFRIPPNEQKAFLHFARGNWRFTPPEIIEDTPWRAAARSMRTNLPAPLTSFIGREREQTEILKLINKHRLVTLVGAGGVGKTRLSLKVGEQSLEAYPHGVWRVELAPILDPLLVPRTTAITIGLRDEPQRPVIDMLSHYLRQKQMLIILDNCEHLLDACAQLAGTLLKNSPSLTILATSREALGILGEATYHVPSLQLPDLQQLLERFRDYESVRLFEERAQLAQMDFCLTIENGASVAKICNRLDGIPLAIELAAARVSTFSTEQIATRLQESFDLLTTGNRAALPRHQTLQASIDWSYDLLSPAEQILFQRLSVFVNGWTLEAAKYICSDPKIKCEDVSELLFQLINKSLVILEETQSEPRYHMLETMRQYAHEKLVDSGESNLLRDRHLDCFLKLAETAEPHLIRPEQLNWLAQLDADYENLRLALEWALSKDSPELSLRLCAALGPFWDLHAYFLEGSKWLARALSKSSQDPGPAETTARVRALYQDARLANGLDDIERLKASAELSLALAQEGPDKRDIAIARFYVAFALYRRNQNEDARALAEQSLAEFRELNDAYWEAYSFRHLSIWLELQGKLKTSEWCLQALQLARRAGERLNLGEALWFYSGMFYAASRIEEGMKYAKEADALYKQLGYKANPTSQAFGITAWLNGDYEKARSYFGELQERLSLLGEKNIRASVISSFLGRLTLEQGNVEQAQAYFEEGLATARELQDERLTVFRLGELSTVFYLQGNINKYKQYLRDGSLAAKELSSNTKRDFLVSVLDSIHIYNPGSAAHLLGAIYVFERDSEEPISPLTKRYYSLAEADARESLGNAAFEFTFEEGQKMSLDQALDLVWTIVQDL
jgi:non-specific serine/threonine protein kinase